MPLSHESDNSLFSKPVDQFDPARPDFSPYGFSCVRWTATTMPRCDRHNEVELNLLESGSLVYLIGGKRVVVHAGRLTAFWAGFPHQVVEIDGMKEYFVLTVPLSWFLQWRLPSHFTKSILNGATLVEPDPGVYSSDRARFEVWCTDARMASEQRSMASLLEIEARLRRLADSVTTAVSQTQQGKMPTALEPILLSRAEKMACFIAQNYAEPLTAESIGRHVGLNPN